MSVTVRIPTILRSYTDEKSQVEAEGNSVAEVIDALDVAHPGIKARIVDEEGAMRRFVNVYVKDEDVRFADGLQTKTPEGSQMSIIPAVAGGA